MCLCGIQTQKDISEFNIFVEFNHFIHSDVEPALAVDCFISEKMTKCSHEII